MQNIVHQIFADNSKMLMLKIEIVMRKRRVKFGCARCGKTIKCRFVFTAVKEGCQVIYKYTTLKMAGSDCT